MSLRVDVRYGVGAFSLEVAAAFDAPVTALLGPSGAGKSTLLMLIAGLRRPDAGRIVLGDQVVCDVAAGAWVPAWRRRVGVVFQTPRLWPHLRVGPTIRYGGRFREDDVVAICGLSGLLDRRPAGLSGGEARRVAIARAVMSAPAVLLLDEPFAGLDPPRRAQLRALITELATTLGLLIVVVTHDVGEAQALTDHVVLLDAGRVVAQGEVQRVLDEPRAFALVDAMGVANLLSVTVVARDEAAGVTRARLGEQAMTLPLSTLTAGAAGRVSIRPEEIVLGVGEPATGLSVRNRLRATIVELVPVGPLVMVHLDAGQPLRAEVTRDAVTALQLAPGREVWVYAKATAFRWRA